ncbi:unnamed protein product [Rotaria sp. Silwood2]|nr:unnamed protein product [Rotaria sp. Silwood2]CAF4462533.1 unnamed protein product [Rotaria sp. Silwood2]
MAYYDDNYSVGEDDEIHYTSGTSDVDVNSSDYNDDDDDYDDSDEDDMKSESAVIATGSDTSNKSDDEQDDSDGHTTDASDIELWSGTSWKPDSFDYNGTLRLSNHISSTFPKHPTSIDIFRLFLTPEIATYIVDQSNLYRTQNNLTQQSPMTEDDFYSLLRFLYYSSTVPLPSKSDYWTSYCRQPIVADSITRNRIDYLLSILHLNDNTTELDKGEKIEPLINLFNERCRIVAEPEAYISIDEQMIGYKGKTAPKSFRQYMPNKPTKRGFKVWAKCGVSGFVYEMKLYRGSKEIILNKNPTTSLNRTLRSTTTTNNNDEIEQRQTNVKEYGLSGVVVLDFLKHIPIGSRIFVDNYFSSFRLIQKMTDLGYGFTCTLRSNRISQCPVPSDKLMKKKPRGYYESYLSDDERCIIVAWKDNKRVLLGSNCVGEEPLFMIKRWNKNEGNHVQVKAPQIVTYYNKYMGGVDTLDMMISLHPIPFRSKKWYTRIIWRIFDLIIINSWILLNQIRGTRKEINGPGNWRKFRLFHFKTEVAKFLLQKPQLLQIQFATLSSSTVKKQSLPILSSNDDYNDENNPPKKLKREYKSAVEKTLRFDGNNHFPKFIEAKNASRCKNEKCKQKTYWYCPKCDVHLCLTSQRNCFNEYHVNS